jgi:hypothetical protein
MASELLDSVKKHLEHIGYKVDVTDKGGLVATHPKKLDFGVTTFNGGALLLAPFRVKEGAAVDSREFLEFLNDVNMNATVGRVVWNKDSKAVFGEAWYPNSYETIAFGQFFDLWLDDTTGYLLKQKAIGSRYLE